MELFLKSLQCTIQGAITNKAINQHFGTLMNNTYPAEESFTKDLFSSVKPAHRVSSKD